LRAIRILARNLLGFRFIESGGGQMSPKSHLCLAAAAMCTLAWNYAAQAEPAAPQITARIDDNNRIVLSGNTRSEASPRYDRGMVSDRMPLEHMQLLLRRPAAREMALEQLINSQQNRRSPDFHTWLTAGELGQRFGMSQQDIATISRWLSSHGFQVEGVLPSRMVIQFSGTAGDVREAFHTEIHKLSVNGTEHIANMSDPQIPAALAPAVAGIVSLNDFRPHPEYKLRRNYTWGSDTCYPLNSQGSGGLCYSVVPPDLATIYNFTPAFNAGITGENQTVVVIEDTNVYNPPDWAHFRAVFGLAAYSSGSFTQEHPSGSLTCTNPGVNGDEGEVIIDAEYSSAAAPGAAIVLASCSDTDTNFGGLIALENLLGNTPLPQSVSISYGECEAENGQSQNEAFSDTYEQAVSEGVSVFVSSGDEGAASCDADESNATHGIGVSGLTSSPYDVSVGGTDFGDAYANEIATYWNSSNTAHFGSAISYIPEIPWNDSCASRLIANYYSGSKVTYGSTGYCNAGTYHTDFITTASGSGGPSGCATGSASISGVVSGTCAGWPKPSYQAGFIGIVGDNVRDVPDISLFAANGVWSHYYLFCDSDGGGCSGTPDNWAGAGGTSFASPIMAGVQALVDQKTGASQGNPNTTLYSLAATEYGSKGDKKCDSTKGNMTKSTCVFYDITEGDMDVNCSPPHGCYSPSGEYGVLSTSITKYKIAYGATRGWDFASGIGSVNVNNLINAWPQ
jgi:subtilase family serine protease